MSLFRRHKKNTEIKSARKESDVCCKACRAWNGKRVERAERGKRVERAKRVEREKHVERGKRVERANRVERGKRAECFC